mgnify:CR=1 FL=1
MSLSYLTNGRKWVRKSITEHFQRRESYHLISPADKVKNLGILKKLQQDLREFDEKIQSQLWDDSNVVESEAKLNDEYSKCAQYAEKLIDCISILESIPTALPSAVPNAHGSRLAIEAGESSNGGRSMLKSPIAPLPKFSSGEGEDLLRFFLEFEETVGKFNLVNYDKYLLLKQQLSGRALVLVGSLETDQQSYEHAKSLLVEAFASPETIIFKTIQQITEMKLPLKGDSYSYIAKMRKLIQNVRQHDITVDHFLQFFFWSGMNSTFQNIFYQLTMKNRPSLKELSSKFFEVAERYEILSKNQSQSEAKVSEKKVQNTSLAVNVNYKNFKNCTLCTFDKKDAAHPLHKCNVYQTPKDKVDKLTAVGGCMKCGDTAHAITGCKFRLRNKCMKCNEWHFSFLCLKPRKESTANGRTVRQEQSTANSASTSLEISSNTIYITEVLYSNFSNQCILPSFSAKIDGTHIHGLCDQGCQSNLILESVAQNLNAEILHHSVSLVVNGINASKAFNSKLIQFEIEMGSQVYKVQALTIPSIPISLQLPQLGKIVDEFRTRGFLLADQFLNSESTEISGLQFILGTKGGYCLPGTDVVFGHENTSVYVRTPSGIVLKGDIDTLLKDVELLAYENIQECNNTVLTATDFIGDMEPEASPDQSSLEPNVLLSTLQDGPVPQMLQPSVMNDSGEVDEEALQSALRQVLNYESQTISDADCHELNDKLVNFTLDNITRNDEGRFTVPLLWNSKVSHLLGKNVNLSKAILKSTRRKFGEDSSKLKLINDVFKEQVRSGIIERIENLDSFLQEAGNFSFMPHMPVFRFDHETSKVRVVFLSNLKESDPLLPLTVSHNESMYSGPCLNAKLATSLINVRFGKNLLCFDIKKAFNNLSLSEEDSNKLLFFWYRDVEENDFTIVAYRNIRLSFGLRCSPALLMLSLYKLLILENEGVSESLIKWKRLIYHCTYMDNCAISTDSFDELHDVFNSLKGIFEPYGFPLQQFITNDEALQKQIDLQDGAETDTKVKLLGLNWDREKDSLSCKPINLDSKVNTKRGVLSTYAAQFDPFNYCGPLLNRCRLFLHKLQNDSSLTWDEKLSDDRLREFQNICRQANSSPVVEISRFVGSREDNYEIIAFADSSKEIMGAVLFLRNSSQKTMHFILAKSKIVNKSMITKSIPSLELKSVALATECAVQLFKDLTGPSCVCPVKIDSVNVYSDSMVALAWLESFSVKLAKMQKRSVFVMNQITKIDKLCEIAPVTFRHISGSENPADYITRCFSYNQLAKTCYYSGPEFLSGPGSGLGLPEDQLSVTIPNPLVLQDQSCNLVAVDSEHSINEEETSTDEIDVIQVPCVPPVVELSSEFSSQLMERYSTLQRLVRSLRGVLKFINKLKLKLKVRDPLKFSHISTFSDDHNFHSEALESLIRSDQSRYCEEIVNYFKDPPKAIREIPNIVKQLNPTLDDRKLIRIQSKFSFKEKNRARCPILLSNESRLTTLIVLDYHEKMSHSGCYSVLSELRKTFYIRRNFSFVKKLLRKCVKCKRFKERCIKLNQSSYRDFRETPSKIPFRNVYLDYLGPYTVKVSNRREKVWILIVTCMFSRGINLKVVRDLTKSQFLRAFQIHSFQYGVPEFCISDLGVQLVAGAKIVQDYLSDPETRVYLNEHGVSAVKFQNYYKGNSRLGAMVESAVKLVKRLISGSIGRNVLNLHDFEYIIEMTIHLVNRRPVAFREALRDECIDVPSPITPEAIIHGHDLLSVNVIPDLQPLPSDQDWTPNGGTALIRDEFAALREVRKNLVEKYNNEFISGLIDQAVDRSDRYKPVTHNKITVGDIILLKEDNCKPSNYPMGIVKKIEVNNLGEVTGATILKGSTGELTKRHSTNIIPLLCLKEEHSTSEDENLPETEDEDKTTHRNNRPQRVSAVASRQKTFNMLNEK